MIKSIGKFTLASLLAAIVLGVPVRVAAADMPSEKAAPTEKAPEAKAKAKSLPFTGKLGAVDQSAKTLTLDEKTKRTFQITSETKITKSGKPVTLEEGVVGEPVSGSYQKGDDGKLTAKSVHFGGKAAVEGEMKKKKKEAVPAADAAPAMK
ncbi:MAG: hypothetical protein JWR19_125 [Pedosphaera sp.]|nr:hypothetical protein [Pedosphaera sp.]